MTVTSDVSTRGLRRYLMAFLDSGWGRWRSLYNSHKDVGSDPKMNGMAIKWGKNGPRELCSGSAPLQLLTVRVLILSSAFLELPFNMTSTILQGSLWEIWFFSFLLQIFSLKRKPTVLKHQNKQAVGIFSLLRTLPENIVCTNLAPKGGVWPQYSNDLGCLRPKIPGL